jgi:hypothetical protein
MQNKTPGVSVTKNMIPENGIVVQNLVIRPVVRQSQDIGKWRSALQSAEATNPNRVQLYDLYDDLMLDPRLKSLIQKRILGVTKIELMFVDKDGNEIPEMTDLLSKSVIRKLRKEIAKAKFWGIKVIELMKNPKFSVYSIPVKHIKPKEGKIVFQQHGQEGILYRNPPVSNYVFEVGDYDDLGLLLEAAPYVIYKRGGFGDWAQYAEIFGMPFRKGKYNGYDQVARQQLETALEKMGGAGYAAIPNETDIEFIENKSTNGSTDLYNTLIKACNEELAVLILGQTETTTKTAGSLGGNDDTHEATEDEINMDDRAEELAIFNEQIKPILKNLGYPVDNGNFIHKKDDEKISIKDKVDVFIKLKNEFKLPIADDHVYEETGIPKPTDYKLQKSAAEAQNKPIVAPKNQTEPTAPFLPNNPKNKAQNAKLAIEEDDPQMMLNLWDKMRLKLADFFAQAPKG